MSVDLLGEARRRIEAGDPASARRLAERALALAREAGAPQAVAACAQILGECLFVIGNVEGARLLAGEALQLDEATGNPVALAADLNLMGVVHLTAGQNEAALEILQRSYDLRSTALGPDHEETIESLNNLAVAHWRSGAKDLAIATHEDALRRCESALGESHRRTAETLNALAVKLQSLPDQTDRARQLYERGLAAAEAALGPDSELVARLLVNVATARVGDGDLDGTGALLDRALALHERHFGPTSRWTAWPLDTQGNLALLEGRHEDARRAFERAFVIRMNELGPTDRETLDAAIGLATALGSIDAPGMGEATAIYLPVMALQPDEDTGGLPRSALPDPRDAEVQLRRIASRIEQRLHSDPAQAAAISRASALEAQADASYLAGDLGAAADQLREAIALLEVARGDGDPSLVEPLHRLKLALRVGGLESGVMPILERIHTILLDAYGEIHPQTIRALGEIYWQERREFGPAGGRETADRILRQVELALGSDSPAAHLLDEVLGAARAQIPAGSEPWGESLSVRRERILAAPSPIADELLSELAGTPWPTLQHAYGPALDTPRHLRLLVAEDEQVRDDALDLLGGSLIHQGSVFTATVPAMRAVRRLAGDSRVPGRDRLIAFLKGGVEVAEGAEGPSADALRSVLADLPTLLRFLISSDDEPAVTQAATQALAELDG